VRSRRGPDLPYTLVAAATPWGKNWVVVSAKMHGGTFAVERPQLYPSFMAILDERPAYETLVMNVPIGYRNRPEDPPRRCDVDARSLVTWRGGAIHNAPSRAVLSGEINWLDGNLDAVTATLLPRIREVAAEMSPFRQRVVYEGNPELSFYQLNGERPLDNSKKIVTGRDERRTLLMDKIAGIEKVLDAPTEIPEKHVYDAAVLLWTARRVHGKGARRVPIDPEWDEEGIRMEIVF
jgi:predicted RNase H-like nuclease